MKKPLLLLLVLLLAAALAACSSKESPTSGASGKTAASADSSGDSSATASNNDADGKNEPQVEIRVMWWGDQHRADITTQMLQAFGKKHPNIKVVPEFSPFDGYFDKLNTELASGTAPDAFTLGSNILDYSLKGVLLDLNPYKGTVIDVSDISPSLMAFNTFDGKLSGISIGANSRAMMINTAVLKKAGVDLPPNDWTWDDYAKLNDAIAQKLGKGFYGSYDYSGQMDTLDNYLKQMNNKGIYDNDNHTLGFTVEEMQKWFAFWDAMRKVGGIVTPELEVSANPDDNTKSLVPKGKVAMQYIPTNLFAGYQGQTQDELVLVPVPRGAKFNANTVESSQNIVGYANTKHPKEVAELMNFWVNDPEAAKILGNNRGVPVSSKMRAALQATASPADQVVYHFLDVIAKDAGKATYNIPGYNEFNQLLTKDSQAIAFGRSDITGASEDLFANGKKILEANLNSAKK